MDKKAKLEELVSDLKEVAKKHGVILDKYSKENKQIQYFLKITDLEIEVNIEDVFPMIEHG